MSNPLTPEQVQALLEQCDIVALDWPQLHERNLTVPVGVPTLRALLTFYAERSGTCRWVHIHGGDWQTPHDAIRLLELFCPDCGRTVEVTR